MLRGGFARRAGWVKLGLVMGMGHVHENTRPIPGIVSGVDVSEDLAGRRAIHRQPSRVAEVSLAADRPEATAGMMPFWL